MFIDKIKNSNSNKLKNGFTVIEMMVTLGIITLLTTMVLVHSRQSELVSNLAREGNRIAFEIQKAKSSAMLILQKGSTSQKKICGWGVYFDQAPVTNQNPKESFIIFQDFCESKQGDLIGNGVYDEGEMVETINLLKNIEIFETNISSVVFIPPEPKVFFSNKLTGANEGYIKIRVKGEDYQYFEIKVSPIGQIYKTSVSN
ncbi:MAG: prepilin-type N-terminal cleavage/methylation domain-containing protein [Candidatus Pacebacteria bacterium]|nr:prepilin-type N-terminal cleavage/methylation domain-containing protein [Candidatus Paceibacterota bacterium]